MKHPDVIFLYSCPPFSLVRIVVGHTHHFQALIFILSIQFFQMGITFPTGNTPTGPEIDNHVFSPEVCQRKHFSVDILFAEYGSRTARRTIFQLLNFLIYFLPQLTFLYPFTQTIENSLCFGISHGTDFISQLSCSHIRIDMCCYKPISNFSHFFVKRLHFIFDFGRLFRIFLFSISIVQSLHSIPDSY